MPLLLGLRPVDIQGPLLQFQMTTCDKQSIKLLINSVNTACEESGLDDARLSDSFELWRPRFETALERVRAQDDASSPQLEANEDPNTRMLEEILTRVRSQQIHSPRIGYNVSPGAIADLAKAWSELERLVDTRSSDDILPLSDLLEIYKAFAKPVKHILSIGRDAAQRMQEKRNAEVRATVPRDSDGARHSVIEDETP